MSDMPERILAWREEDEYIDHVLINKCWGETSEVPSWDATEYVRADRIAALTAQVAEKDEQLVSVLQREAATYERHDAKMEATDARAEALLKRAAQMAYEVWDDPEALAKAILALIPEKQP